MAYVNRGNKLTKSTFKNIGQIAVYLDEMVSGWEISDSSFDGASLGVLIGGGRRNTVLRNTLKDVQSAMDLDSRGLQEDRGFCNSSMKRLTELLYPGSPWAARWPELRNLSTDLPCAPIDCEVSDNTYDGSLWGNWNPIKDGWSKAWHFAHRNNTNIPRPTETYTHAGGRVCFQGCPKQSTKRDPASQRCYCNASSPCLAGLSCMAIAGEAKKQCVSCGTGKTCPGLSRKRPTPPCPKDWWESAPPPPPSIPSTVMLDEGCVVIFMPALLCLCVYVENHALEIHKGACGQTTSPPVARR
jgi:hypothetical protein